MFNTITNASLNFTSEEYSNVNEYSSTVISTSSGHGYRDALNGLHDGYISMGELSDEDCSTLEELVTNDYSLSLQACFTPALWQKLRKHASSKFILSTVENDIHGMDDGCESTISYDYLIKTSYEYINSIPCHEYTPTTFALKDGTVYDKEGNVAHTITQASLNVTLDKVTLTYSVDGCEAWETVNHNSNCIMASIQYAHAMFQQYDNHTS